MARVTQLLRELAMDCREVWRMEPPKAMRPGRRRMISVKQQEKRMHRVASMAVPPADSQRRRVVRALPNSDP
jgi:hypothetical protein